MAPLRRSSRNVCGVISFRAVIICAAALSLLWVRNVSRIPPHSSHSVAFQSSVDHDHRQCFDHDESECAAPPSALPGASPVAVSWDATYAFPVLVEFLTDGWHYNRPPPRS
jgi:hypothetical protein